MDYVSLYKKPVKKKNSTKFVNVCIYVNSLISVYDFTRCYHRNVSLENVEACLSRYYLQYICKCKGFVFENLILSKYLINNIHYTTINCEEHVSGLCEFHLLVVFTPSLIP
jgi:hypothetical protein